VSTSNDLRRIALALPEVEEHTHFRLPAFRVRGKVFAVIQSDSYAVLHLDANSTAMAVSAQPGAIEETRRGNTLVGVRVDLPELDLRHLEQLLASAWRHRAPKALVTQHERVPDK
jgi:hypothetical protein